MSFEERSNGFEKISLKYTNAKGSLDSIIVARKDIFFLSPGQSWHSIGLCGKNKNRYRLGKFLFFCRDSGKCFFSKPLANTKRVTTQHFCEKFQKVVTRTVGVKSRGCMDIHTHGCVSAVSSEMVEIEQGGGCESPPHLNPPLMAKKARRGIKRKSPDPAIRLDDDGEDERMDEDGHSSDEMPGMPPFKKRMDGHRPVRNGFDSILEESRKYIDERRFSHALQVISNGMGSFSFNPDQNELVFRLKLACHYLICQIGLKLANIGRVHDIFDYLDGNKLDGSEESGLMREFYKIHGLIFEQSGMIQDALAAYKRAAFENRSMKTEKNDWKKTPIPNELESLWINQTCDQILSHSPPPPTPSIMPCPMTLPPPKPTTMMVQPSSLIKHESDLSSQSFSPTMDSIMENSMDLNEMNEMNLDVLDQFDYEFSYSLSTGSSSASVPSSISPLHVPVQPLMTNHHENLFLAPPPPSRPLPTLEPPLKPHSDEFPPFPIHIGDAYPPAMSMNLFSDSLPEFDL